MMGDRLLADVFDRHATTAPFAEASHEGHQAVTFAELVRRSQALSGQLAQLVRPGERVVILLPNSTAYVVAFFAIARVGGVVAPLSHQYRERELTYYLTDLDPAAIVTTGPWLDRIAGILPGLGRAPALLDVAEDRTAHLVRAGNGAGDAMRTPGDSPPLLQLYTSGSTGPPKAVVRTHAQLLAEVDALRRVFTLDARDRFLGAAPFCHVNGLVRTMLSAMLVGGTLYPIETFQRRDVLATLTTERITVFGGVPQMFALLSQTRVEDSVDLSALRVVFSASAPLLPRDNSRFHERYDVWIRQLYGSTETGTISVSREVGMELQSVGLPLEGVEVEIVDETGRRMPPGQEGEVTISSPFMASGYFGNPVATAERFRGGFYVSGDLGSQDRAGRLTLTGRKGLSLNRGGFKVNPAEVEAILLEHPNVVEAAVFGRPGPHGEDVICCGLVVSQPCTREEIFAHCASRIADYKIPARIEFRDALPRSPAGKLLRARLQEGS